MSQGGSSANNGTQVYRFADEPFEHFQCHRTTDSIPGPAATFGEDVCVNYVALTSSTVRVQGDDVAWSLIQHGTATITSDDGELLYEGPFQVEEHAKDLAGDAGCLRADNHAYFGHCTAAYTNLDWLNYTWKITGNSVYFYNVSISAPGQYCGSSNQGGEFGPAC